MSILEHAIQTAGSVGRLAQDLGVRQNVVSNWRARGLPRPWELVLDLKYGKQAGSVPADKTEGGSPPKSCVKEA